MAYLSAPPPTGQVHYAPPVPGYLPGEQVAASITAIEDDAPIVLELRIESIVGSGFAGQVYRARVLPASPRGWPERLAVKVLRPRSGWKRLVRNGLFWLCFQAPFAPQVDEAAVRSGLLWQMALRAAVRYFLGPHSVTRPLGYYWDPHLHSFVELHEWVESRPERYETDPRLVARWLGRAADPAPTEMVPSEMVPSEMAPSEMVPSEMAPSEMACKKSFMDALVGLCHAMGAEGLARQYEWYTLVAQANVLTSRGEHPCDPDAPAAGTFTVVDCRVGLAFPFFLPFTPVHLHIALSGLRRGRLVHYDEADLPRLKAFLEAYPAVASQVPGLFDRLAQADRAYRAVLPDLWHTRARLLSDPAFRRALAAAGLARWVRLGLAAPQSTAGLADRPLLLALLMLLYPLPVLGPLAVRLAAHPGYRAHLRGLLTSGAYRRASLETARARDLPEWTAFQRVAPRHAGRLARSAPAYLFEALACAWLPAAAHRFLTDSAARAAWLHAHLVRPVRLMVSRPERTAWLDGIVRGEQERGLIHARRAAILREQIREPRMQQIVRHLGFVALLEVFSRLVYLALGVYGISHHDLVPLGIAALGPIPPSGIPRLLYVLALTLHDLFSSLVNEHRLPGRRQALARLGQVLVAPWRWVGNLFPLFEISAYYPRLALLLAGHFAGQAVNNVPVFGGRGKLLEYWTFQLIYNVPVSLKALLRGSRESTTE